ncbi:contact-dependent growth inhibition system immunity protein [Coralloluteibacterium thermophilus]|uniref:Contact-dependent growth inhibition system immunity protein n=1 Tax=Coralloluteibacterium thermophilum TaxID=2707049 RepID=A0ABV9NQ02_9GAMM
MSAHPTLENFFSAYFHQDWTQEQDSPEGVVAYYVANESEDEVEGLREDIDRLRAEDLDEDALEALFLDYGCSYDPAADGMTRREWLDDLARQLAE